MSTGISPVGLMVLLRVQDSQHHCVALSQLRNILMRCSSLFHGRDPASQRAVLQTVYIVYTTFLSQSCPATDFMPVANAAWWFHYSSQLHTSLQSWFSTRFAARFSTSTCGFATRFRPAFDFFSKTWSREPQQIRWLVRVLDQMECRNNPF